MLLVVVHQEGLSRRIGADRFPEVMRLLADYAAAASRRTPIALAIVDSAEHMRSLGVDAVSERSAKAIADTIAAVVQQLGDRVDDEVSDLLLVGGDEVIPFWRLTNPVADRDLDPDSEVLSDNPYGMCADASFLHPTVSVGRLCDGGSFDALRRGIEGLTRNHTSRPDRRGAVAIVNEPWFEASHGAMTAMGAGVDRFISPYYRVRPDNRHDLGRRLAYFNLHGFDGESTWQGYDVNRGVYVDAVAPSSFDADMTGTVVVSEACYGAQVNGRTPRNSCALAAHTQGATAFIGATGLVFGSTHAGLLRIANADKMAQLLFQRLSDGDAIGDALRGARRDLLAPATPMPAQYERKTALQFILLGDPSLAA